MSVEKVSVSLDRELLDEARTRSRGRSTLSAYVNDALLRKVLAERQAEYLDSLDRDYGPVGPEIVEAAERQWDALKMSFER